MGRASRKKRARRSQDNLLNQLPATLRDKIEIRDNKTQAKISEALRYLIEPYLDTVDSLRQMTSLVALATVAWNLERLEEEGDLEEYQSFLATIPFADDEDFNVLLAQLTARKRERYPRDERWIVSYDVSKRGSKYHIQAASTLTKNSTPNDMSEE